ncbi:Hcp family type VI secretion system effector [Desulfococcus sp.]|uniref:Hcp family type VI secretion system effector n=1 Tax=Desulfococcus sp. TaxID=2025834 RepID=UPI003593CF62
MPADVFLKIDGIKGESTDDKHKEWIEILSFSWGCNQQASASASTSGGGSTQRVDFADFNIVKTMDSASPLLFKACAKGDHIKEVILELCRAAGDEKLKFMEYKMADVIISNVSVGGSGSGDSTESVSFNYGKIEQTYTKQKREDGTAGGNVPAGWDLKANKPV